MNVRKLLVHVVLAIVVLLAIAQFGPSLVFEADQAVSNQVPAPKPVQLLAVSKKS
jgi:hypothetical protein